MKEYWNSLQPRERQVLVGGATVVFILMFYALVWSPWQSHIARLEKSVASQRADLEWMRGAAAEVQALRGSAPKRESTGGQSLMALADSTARAQGLGNAMKRVQPEGQGRVRVWLEQAPFDDTLRWLDSLTGKYGVRINTVVVEPADGAGLANARVLLEEGNG